MESTIQLKQSLLSTIGGITDRNIIEAISEFVKKKIGKSASISRNNKESIEVAPEVWAILKRVHPVEVKDEKKEYHEYLDEKYK